MLIHQKVLLSGREVHPIIEGGKGVAISNGTTAGHFARNDAVGTFSSVTPDYYDEQGNLIRTTFDLSATRSSRHEALVAQSIRGGVAQAQLAHDISGGRGRIHMNMLWECGGAVRIINGILEQAKGLIHGVTAGAGMPYGLSDIAMKHQVYYYPIVSSARAFSILWKRSYSKAADLLGGVVYEDPWLAGGHNGISNSEDPNKPEAPYERLKAIRAVMDGFGLNRVPIILAGGVWYLREFIHLMDDKAIAPIAFQLGTRTLLTEESPISKAWKRLLMLIQKGDVILNRFSPSGFYSSAYKNNFLKRLIARSERQISFARSLSGEFTEPVSSGGRQTFYVRALDITRAKTWITQGFSRLLPTPDSTVVFVEPVEAEEILKDQRDCKGCLSACLFSNWSDHLEGNTTGRSVDPRSFCIHKTLDAVAHGGSIEDNLVFAGHRAFEFAKDPFYANNFIPSIAQLVDRLLTGD